MTKKIAKKMYVVKQICKGERDDIDFAEGHSPESAFEQYKKDYGLYCDTYENTTFVVCELTPVLKYSQTMQWKKENV